MKNKIVLALTISLLMSKLLFSQDTIVIRHLIDWNIDAVSLQENNKPFPAITFPEAITDLSEARVPFFYEKTELPSGYYVQEVILDQLGIEEVDLSGFTDFDISDLPSAIDFKSNPSTSRKIDYSNVLIAPVAFDPNSGNIRLLKEFEIQLVIYKKTAEEKLFSGGRQNSVLANGNWYKFRTNKTGVHKISYSNLQSMGVNVGSIDPRNIRIYGNGAGMLPEANSQPAYDQLMENAIQVIGEEDGSFDSGDYILLYGEAPTTWTYFPGDETFHHVFNVYSDYTFYFLTADLGPGKRIETQNSGSLEPNITVTTTNDYDFHEIDAVNLVGTGRKWYELLSDNEFGFQKSAPGILADKKVKLRLNVAARSFKESYYKIYADNEMLKQVSIPKVSETHLSAYAHEKTVKLDYVPSSANINILLEYIKTTSNSTGWLDYLEVNYERSLRLSGSQMNFRNIGSTGIGNISEFRISNANSSVKVWDVTDPLNISNSNGSLSGSEFVFETPTETLHEFIAFDGSAFHGVEFVEKTANQDLHGTDTPEMVIITHPDFISESNDVADHHRTRDNMKVEVFTTEQVYNEFSSGAQDITAIRNFMRFLYNKDDGETLKYLMLFGDASYDYKERIPENTNFVPSWESVASLNLIDSYVTDDYFGLLDENEGLNNEGDLDLGIGRLTVMNNEEARQMVDKILLYAGQTPEVMKPWRNYVCMVADDEDGDLHVEQAEEICGIIEAKVENLNIDKIYLDSYTQISTPSGQRYPDAEEAINNRVEKGALIINYIGHGGELGWAHEQVLSISDIKNWENKSNLPVFITATCEFSRYDDPLRTSAGEFVFLNPHGGAISMYTTSRATYAGSNKALVKQFYLKGFRKTNGEYPRMGDIMRLSKIASSSDLKNKRKYVLLGDPALKLAFPIDSVITTKINGIEINEVPDTLKALAEVSISGSIYSCNGGKIEDYNGTLYPTVFDKKTKFTTFGQDGGSSPQTFFIRKNIVYNGKAPINNGDFEFTFIVPKDIAYNYGFGRISYYAHDNDSDASGFFENYIVGGYNDDVVPDTIGPEINLFINDTTFISGGITDQDPIMLAYVNDQSGINTVGNGIGHDIIAILDGQTDNPYLLNDYYEADLGKYTSGTISYPFFELAEGKHTLYLKVWDVFNNSSEKTIEFEVINSTEFTIENLYNYPNPFSGHTRFVFEHNQPNVDLDVEIQIFSLSGRLVNSIKRDISSAGYKSTPILWYGTSANGAKLARGLYIYRLIVKDKLGNVTDKRGKMIIAGH